MRNKRNLRDLRVGLYKTLEKNHIKTSAYLCWLDSKQQIHTHSISLKLANALIEAGMDCEG
jgi:hypothetical protein